MPTITLNTKCYTDCTLGRLSTISGYSCFTLELPWKHNKPNVSCIPPGRYKWKKRLSPNKGYVVVELIDVPDREYIQIHIGNRTVEILGCVLPGKAIKDYNDDGIPDVIDSKAAFNAMMARLPDEGTIEVIRD